MSIILKFHQGYQFPNQPPQYLDKVIKLSNYRPDKPVILCVGGVFYSHYLKAKYPKNSYIEAIDNNQVSITGQCLSALNNIYQRDNNYIRLIQLNLPVKDYQCSLFQKSIIKRIYEIFLTISEYKKSKENLIKLFEKYLDKHPWLTREKVRKYIHENTWKLTRPTNGDPKLIINLKVKVPDSIILEDITEFNPSRKYNFISTNNVLEQVRDVYGEEKTRKVFARLIDLLETGGIIEISTNSRKVNQKEFIALLVNNLNNLDYGPSFVVNSLTQSKKHDTTMEVLIIKKVR